jgi:phosphate/sulfate permease
MEIKEILTIAGWIVAPILSFVIGRLSSKYVKAKEENQKSKDSREQEIAAMKETCKYVLKKSLQDDYNYYVEEIGWCSVEDKTEVEKAYEIYHSPAIDGNGQGTRYYKAIMALPEHPPQKAE